MAHDALVLDDGASAMNPTIIRQTNIPARPVRKIVRRPNRLIKGQEAIVPTNAMAYYIAHQVNPFRIVRATYQTQSHVKSLARSQTRLLEEIDGISLQDRSTHLLNRPSPDSNFRSTKVGTLETFEISDTGCESFLNGACLGEKSDCLLRGGDVGVGLALQSTDGEFCFVVAAMLDDWETRMSALQSCVRVKTYAT